MVERVAFNGKILFLAENRYLCAEGFFLIRSKGAYRVKILSPLCLRRLCEKQGSSVPPRNQRTLSLKLSFMCSLCF